MQRRCWRMASAAPPSPRSRSCCGLSLNFSGAVCPEVARRRRPRPPRRTWRACSVCTFDRSLSSAQTFNIAVTEFRVWALCISVMEDVRRDIWNENSERHWYLSFTTLFASVFFTLQTPQKNLMTFNREHKTYWNWLRMNKIRPNTILHLKLKSRNYLHFPAFKNIFIPLFQLHYLLVHRMPVNVGIALVIT